MVSVENGLGGILRKNSLARSNSVLSDAKFGCIGSGIVCPCIRIQSSAAVPLMRGTRLSRIPLGK